MIDKAISVLSLTVILAIVAVLVSKRAQTANVLSGLLKGMSGLIKAAQSPVTG